MDTDTTTQTSTDTKDTTTTTTDSTKSADTGKSELELLKEQLEFQKAEAKKAFEDRDKVKKKLQDIADKKLKDDGDLATLLKQREDELSAKDTELIEAKKKADAYDERIKKEREELINSIEDKDLKKIAEKLEPEDLKLYAEKHGKKELGVDTSNSFANRNNTKDKTPSEKLQGIYKD